MLRHDGNRKLLCGGLTGRIMFTFHGGRFLWLGATAIVLLMCLGESVHAQSTSAGAAAMEHFERKIRPLLLNRCVKCHDGEKAKGKLRLDSAGGLAMGGASGPALVAGKPEQSLLIKLVRHMGDVKMPPDSKLRDQEINDLVTWVKNGAIWPGGNLAGPKALPTETRFTQEQKAFWAFQPIAEVSPPWVKNHAWAKSPLDQFILAKLEAAGLTPAAGADKRTLLRRATFDLTGLPPTPQEIAAFLADTSSDAFAKVVDRLLNSHHYGERWARHWLDAVRYAETTANDGNFVTRYAWRYRDYVVRAFNQDKPYDQFVIEQLAGDLLPATTDHRLAADRVIATGLLMLGPKALAEPDKEQVRMDIVDDQIDVTGRVFLGMTLSCARCHDHKFDPIPTADYYSLAGIFRSTEVMRDEVRNAGMWQEWPLVTAPGEKPILVMAPKEGVPRNLKVHLRGNHLTLGHVTPRRFLQIVDGPKSPPLTTTQSGRLELARWIASKNNPLAARVMVNRLWQHHFGVGLVATSDNFGVRGEKPSHPQLLDWLAARFIHKGWSVKEMHRLIMLSSTYQTSGVAHEKGLQTDPTHRLLWRMPRRRLDAESLRDAMLAVSGKLDRKVGGDESGEFLFREGEVIDKSRDYIRPNRVNADHAFYLASTRRSLYLPSVRNALPDVLTLFDSADPNSVTAVRNETTVTPQALFLLNNPFVREQALHFAKRLLADAGETDANRIRTAYRLALGRDPTDDETKTSLAFVAQYANRAMKLGYQRDSARLSAWQSYCQTMLCRNEFLYVD